MVSFLPSLVLSSEVERPVRSTTRVNWSETGLFIKRFPKPEWPPGFDATALNASSFCRISFFFDRSWVGSPVQCSSSCSWISPIPEVISLILVTSQPAKTRSQGATSSSLTVSHLLWYECGRGWLAGRWYSGIAFAICLLCCNHSSNVCKEVQAIFLDNAEEGSTMLMVRAIMVAFAVSFALNWSSSKMKKTCEMSESWCISEHQSMPRRVSKFRELCIDVSICIYKVVCCRRGVA